LEATSIAGRSLSVLIDTAKGRLSGVISIRIYTALAFMADDQSKPASFSVEFQTPLGLIRGKVEIDTGPTRLAELVPTAYGLTDILVQRARGLEEKAGRKFTCGPGCGTCCCQMVALSPPEAFYLADLVASFPGPQREEVLGRMEQVLVELERRNLINDLLDPDYSDEVVLPIAREYFFLKMPCPFLKNQSCGIHPYRPIACREYNVTSPADGCIDPYRYGVARVPMPFPLSAPLSILAAKLTGSKPRLIPLTLSLRWVAEHSNLKDCQWPGVDLFQRFMDIVGRVPLEDSSDSQPYERTGQ
jgi:Fe-S-cluster containining protein